MNDREVAETIRLIDTALASENEAVKNALDKLIMLVKLSGEENEGPIAEELFRLSQESISKDIVIERLNEIIQEKEKQKVYTYAGDGTGSKSWGMTNDGRWPSTTISWK